MSTRDYVRRGKPPAKKKTAVKKRPTPTRNGPHVPWLAITLALFGIAGFGWFLYQIDGSAVPPPMSQSELSGTSPAPVPAAARPASASPQPSPPKEEWQYMKELPQKRIEVELPKTKQETRPYLMQCGSFRTRGQADELKAMIAFQGLSSEVRESNGKNGTWFRVILGPYERKRLAEKDRHILARAKIRTCQIWFW
jgi:cell division protein FtsN